MSTGPTALDRPVTSRPFLFWWMIISLLLNILLGILWWWPRDDGQGASDDAAPKRSPLAPPEAAPLRAKSPTNKKAPSTPEPTLSWEAFNILALEPTRPALPEFDSWLARHAEALRMPVRTHNAMVRAAAEADSAFTRLEHQRMTPGANGERMVSISPADMISLIKTFETSLSRDLDPETTRALVQVAEGWALGKKHGVHREDGASSKLPLCAALPSGDREAGVFLRSPGTSRPGPQ